MLKLCTRSAGGRRSGGSCATAAAKAAPLVPGAGPTKSRSSKDMDSETAIAFREMEPKKRIGIVGFGKIGEFFVRAVHSDPAVAARLEVAFVWNRSAEKVAAAIAEGVLTEAQHLRDLDAFASVPVDLIVEVSHPDVIRDYGERFLQHADLMIGSPTSFADAEVEARVRAAAAKERGCHGVYIPAGALWGAAVRG
jgi:hypothetical protein